LQIFDLSGKTNVPHCYQQTKFSKYPKQRIIGVQNNDIRQFVHTNTENTILHTNQSFDTLKQICIYTFKIQRNSNDLWRVAQPLNICLLCDYYVLWGFAHLIIAKRERAR
jgi:hypothetical protein